MEYGTWQAKYALGVKEDNAWESVIRRLKRYRGTRIRFGVAQLTGFSVSRRDEGWLWVVRAQINGVDKVAFVNSAHIVEGLAMAFVLLDRGALKWHDDAYTRKKTP